MPSFSSINPYSGEILGSYPLHSAEQIASILGKTDIAFQSWKREPLLTRGRILQKAQQLLLSRKEELARQISREMGKPIRQSRAEIEKCAGACAFYAEQGGEFLKDEQIQTENSKSLVTYQPLGVILGIMPWNFPFWQVFRFAAPTLMAGNTIVLKHAPNVSGCALAIERIFKEAADLDLFRVLLVDHDTIDGLIAHPAIRAVSLTGSTRAGKIVAERAGRSLKKCVLELGGSDPFILLRDAHLEHAVEAAFQSRLQNAGQSCIAAKRFIVIESIREEFEQRILAKIQAIKKGDPLEEATELGPLARIDLRDNLHRQVQESIQKGAKLLYGGEVQDSSLFYPPTLLTSVKPGMPAYSEELFGPVFAILSVRDEQEAIEVANDTAYGLGATVFTQDLEKGEEMARHLLEAGSCFVNGVVHSNVRLPFGGIKSSGYGRELSHFGIREFTNIKTVVVGG